MTPIKLTILSCLLCLKIVGTTDSNAYCSLPKCPPNTHTMCVYPDKLGPACTWDPSKFHNIGLSQEDRKLLLDEHNKKRSDVATGKTKFPKASNMMQLHWDKEAEHIAQRWALQCTFAHDTCRNNLKTEFVAQNAAQDNLNLARKDRKEPLTGAVNGLYAEEKFMSPADITSFQSMVNGHVVGHFTQLVWATSDRLGCGYIDFPRDNDWNVVHLFCNYVTGGNVLGKPLYKQGEPCSECPIGTVCSHVYEGLCTMPQFDNKEVPPTDNEDEQAGKGGSESLCEGIFEIVLIMLGRYLM